MIAAARTVALVVTVDRYDDPDITDLPGLVRGADRFVHWLSERGVPDENVVRLGGDRPATAAAVEEAITEDVADRDGDLLWIYWAGHGLLLPGDSRRLLLANARRNNRRNIELNALLELYRSDFLTGFDTQIAIVDACQYDVPADRAGHLPQPLALPNALVPVRSRTQRVWLAASSGQRAAYRGGDGLFSVAALDDLTATTDLVWNPDFDRVLTAFQRVVDERAPRDVEQEPVVLEHLPESGASRRELVVPSAGADARGAAPDNPLADHPALRPYLRWLAATHEHTEAQIAGVRVRAPLAGLPWLGEVVADGSTTHARRTEAAYLRSGLRDADRVADEVRKLAARPLPTSLTPTGHVDALDLSGHTASPAESVLDERWRAVVLGHPGGGKTTLVRELARRRADPDAMSRSGRWRLPVLCRAADLMAALEDTPARGALTIPVTAITAGWFGSPPTDPLSGERIPADDLAALVRRASAHGRLLLIVDGLDEVPTREQREDLVRRLTAMVEAGGARYGLPTDNDGDQLLVTSRLVGYYATALAEPVQQLMLRRMPMAATSATGDYWLRAHALAANRGSRATEAALRQFRAVTAADTTSSHRVFDNPYLLVSVLSAVVTGELARYGRAGRGVTRSDLYTFMVDDAVDRATRRRPGLADTPVVDLQTATAYAMHRTSRTGAFDLPALRSCVADAVAHVGGDVDTALQDVQDLGLLTTRGQDLYGFLHQTLEEYLAGRWLVGAADAVDRVAEHVDDARWTEPLRLGLGHLARADPRRFEALVTDLLAGPARQSVATLLSTSVAELTGVRPEHVATMVQVFLEAESPHSADGGDRSATAAALRRLTSAPGGLVGGERVIEPIARALTDALSSADDPWLVAAAARAVEELGLCTRDIADALFDAQTRDSAEHGWRTVRALHAMAAEATAPSTDPDRARLVWDGVSPDDRAALSTVEVARRARSGVSSRASLPASRAPMRQALDDGLVDRVVADPALLRMVLCLYGAVGFHDRRRWRAEQAWLDHVMKNAADLGERQRAAIRLDTVVAMALRRAEGDAVVAPSQITTDSPLTDRLVSWLRAGLDTGQLAARLRGVAASPAEAADARGDALAALCGLRPREFADPTETTLRALTQDVPAVRERLVWRLRRAHFVLGDVVGGASSGDLVSHFATHGLPEDRLVTVSRAVILAVNRVTGQGARGGGWTDWARFATDALAAAVCGAVEDNLYATAVVLDTAGAAIMSNGPDGLARSVAAVPQAVAGYPDHATRWAVHPSSPQHGVLYADALTVIDGLGPAYTFLRCWLLDRLAPVLVPHGYGVEAVCVALRHHGDDPVSVDRTVARYVAAMPELSELLADPDGATHDPGLAEALSAVAARLGGGYQHARAVARLAHLGSHPFTLDDVRGATDLDPLARLRLIELACGLGVLRWSPEVTGLAIECASSLAGRERELAADRLAAVADTTSLRTTTAEPGAASSYADALRDSSDGATLTATLLGHEDERDAGTSAVPVSWAALCTAVMCLDVLAVLRQTSELTADWDDLSSPSTRTAAVALLRRTSRGGLHELTPSRHAVLRDLVTCGDGDAAAAVLAHCRLTSRSQPVDDLRDAAHQRVADIASLLVVEAGTLDVAAVDALPRLLADPDDIVRLRTGIATSRPGRGGPGRPRFTAAALGPATLAQLTRVSHAAKESVDPVCTDLSWALGDVVHNSQAVFRATLARLSEPGQRRFLLGRVYRVDAPAVRWLPGLLRMLDEDDQLALLYSLETIAEDPVRSGVRPEVAQLLEAPLRALLGEVTDDVAAHLLVVLGRLCDPSSRNVVRLVDQVAAGLDPLARDTISVGAAHGLGMLLERAPGLVETDERVVADAVEVLRDAALSSAGELATAGVAGLVRGGWWNDVVELSTTGAIGGELVLQGLLAALRTSVIGWRYRDGLQRSAAFIHTPTHLTGADAVEHTRRLGEALLGMVEDRLDRDGSALDRSFDADLSSYLGVLVALAHRQVAAVRHGVDQFPGLSARIVRHSTGAYAWTDREQGLCLLVLLGAGDRDAVLAVLGAHRDTPVVTQHVVDELVWFDRVEPDGLAELLAATEDPRLGRCHLAVRILVELLRHRCLADDDHRTALRAVHATLARPDAGEQLVTEVDGRLSFEGSFTDDVKSMIARLRGTREPATSGAGRRQLVLRAHDGGDDPIDLVVPSDGIESGQLLLGQIQHHRDNVGRPIPRSTTDALGRVADAALVAGVALETVLLTGPASGGDRVYDGGARP